MPKLSIIQVCRDQAKIVQKDIDQLSGVHEVIVVETRSPAWARNLAAEQATGTVLLFLDDDCIIDQQTIDRYQQHFRHPGIDVIGGPALVRRASKKETLHGLLCSSFLIFGPSRCRYEPVGAFRESNQKELILCNLAFRRKTFLKFKGFSPTLYPGEENELLERMVTGGVCVYHDPLLKVTRSITNSSLVFVKKIFSYARARGRHGHLTSGYYYFPLLFLLTSFLSLYSQVSMLAMIVYMIAIFGEAVRLVTIHRSLSLFLLSMILMPTLHYAYGFGLLLGLLTFFITQGLGHFFNARYRVDVFK